MRSTKEVATASAKLIDELSFLWINSYRSEDQEESLAKYYGYECFYALLVTCTNEELEEVLFAEDLDKVLYGPKSYIDCIVDRLEST